MRRTEAEMERIYGPWAYRAWGYGLPCIVVGCTTRDYRPGTTKRMDCCHVTNGGMGRKATWMGQTFFACWRHHDEADHVLGKQTFATTYQLAVDGVHVADLREAGRVTLERFGAWERALIH